MFRNLPAALLATLAGMLLVPSFVKAQSFGTTVVSSAPVTTVFVAPANARTTIPASFGSYRPGSLLPALNLYFTTAYPPNPPRWDLYPALLSGRRTFLVPPVPVRLGK